MLRKNSKAGYRASEKESEFFQPKMKWLGHEIDENGIKPNNEKVKVNLELKHQENQKQLKSFIGAIQDLAKFLSRPSERTPLDYDIILKNTESKW